MIHTKTSRMDSKTAEKAYTLKYGPFKRWQTLESAGISLADLPVTPQQIAEVTRWRDRITRVLISQSKAPVYIKDLQGTRFMVDEYLDNDPECFRRKFTKKRSAPIKIGINVSGAYGSWHLNALRGGAVLAFCELCKRQGRQYSIEICYGNGRESTLAGECHTRINLLPYANTVTHACLSTDTISEVGVKCVKKLSPQGIWRGFYRLYEYEALGIKEFDFVLDRIETDNVVVEYNRIVNRLKILGLTE